MDIPYFINTFGVLLMQQHSKKIFGGSKRFSNLTLKTQWYHSCGYCDDSRSCEQLNKRVTYKYFEKKLDFEPLSPSVIGNVCYHYNT